MNQTPSNSSTQVSTKHFADKLHSNIIQLARACAIEHSIKVDPDAKSMTRDTVQRQINYLLTDDEKEGIRKLWAETVKIVTNNPSTDWDIKTYARQVYEALKTVGFDNV